MKNQVILLVEDNPDDEMLALRAFKKNNITNEIVVARDGVEALDYLFGNAGYAGRDTSHQPALILLDLKLPKMDGLEVLKALRADARTREPASDRKGRGQISAPITAIDVGSQVTHETGLFLARVRPRVDVGLCARSQRC